MLDYKKKSRSHNGIQSIAMLVIVTIMSIVSAWIWYVTPPKIVEANVYIPFTVEDVEYFTARFTDDSDSLGLKYQ